MKFSSWKLKSPRKATDSRTANTEGLFSILHPQNEQQKENRVMVGSKAGKDAMPMWAEGLDYLGFGEEMIKAGDWISQYAFCISFLPYMITHC